MKANADYIRTIIEENFSESNHEDIREYVNTELSENLESFDSFFETSSDEISEDEKKERVEFIKNIFN